jgi:hypothetical protein
MSPNRIVAGKRDHRVLFLYHIFKQGLQNNHISAPRICPVEDVDITSIAQKYTSVYQDIVEVFENADLPRTFTGEETQQMTSCWLSNFSEALDSLIYVPTETVYFGQRTHIAVIFACMVAERINADIETHLFRIAQDALTKIACNSQEKAKKYGYWRIKMICFFALRTMNWGFNHITRIAPAVLALFASGPALVSVEDRCNWKMPNYADSASRQECQNISP